MAFLRKELLVLCANICFSVLRNDDFYYHLNIAYVLHVMVTPAHVITRLWNHDVALEKILEI